MNNAKQILSEITSTANQERQLTGRTPFRYDEDNDADSATATVRLDPATVLITEVDTTGGKTSITISEQYPSLTETTYERTVSEDQVEQKAQFARIHLAKQIN